MSKAVDELTQKVNTLNAAVATVGTTASSSLGAVQSGIMSQGGDRHLGSTSTNMMQGSLASMPVIPGVSSMGSMDATSSTSTNLGGTAAPISSAPTTMNSGGGNKLTNALASVGSIDPSTLGKGAGFLQAGIGVAQMALAPVAGAYAAAMPTAQIVDSATSYFQSTNRANGISRSAVESATFSAMNGGMTSVGSPAIVSNILANSGFMPGSQQYTSAVSQVALAAKNYGMENSAAANSISSVSNKDIANNLFNLGINTLDAKGNQLSIADISKNLMQQLYGGTPTTEQLNRSIQYGSLQGQLAGFNITDPNTQGLFINNMMDWAKGNNPNTLTNSANNANPTNSIMAMNQSQTGILQGSEANALSGLSTAADLVKKFNDTMGPIIESMAKYKAIIEGGLSTNAGQGVKAAASTFMSGVSNVVGGISNMVMAGAKFLGGGTPGFGAPISTGYASTTLSGAASTSSGIISAQYGATDSSGIWSSTGNKHQGIDLVVPSGTPVHATKDGIVSAKILSADYGQAVMIDHKDGWSSIYAHLSSKEVNMGAQVTAGQEIGKSGQSGNVTGPSLHYEVWHGDSNPVDPALLKGAGQPIDQSSLAGFGGLLSDKQSSGEKAINPNAGTAGDQEFAKALLTKAGISITDSNVSALTTWMHWEGGTQNNAYNPLNTTYDMPGATNFNKVGVKSYLSLTQGVDATYATLTGQSADARGYTKILEDLKNNASLNTVASDVNNSSWGTHIKGVKGGGTPGLGASISVTKSRSGMPLQESNLPVETHRGDTTNNVTINVHISEASDNEAQLFAKKVKDILANDHSVLAIGKS
jgi:murein DD-endopeptidase MepM/ murein hydrolase activator NlpD